MKRFVISTVHIIEIDENDYPDVNEDSVADSLTDTILDSQGTMHETSDDKLQFVPRELISLQVKEVEE